MKQEIYNTLYYYQEDGEEGFDLSEVQLLEKVDNERISKLIKLLENDDKYIVYQAMLILISWNIDEGFNQFNQFFEERWDKLEEFEPHRIWEEDCVYDVISNAFQISIYNGNTEINLLPFIRKILSIYNEVFFEDRLKSLLMKMKSLNIILPEIKIAINNTLEVGKYYQASYLFPVIVLCEKENYAHYEAIFSNLINEDERIKYNIEEAKLLK